jgi:hypothetical protein
MELFALLNAPGRYQARHSATLVNSGCFFTLEKRILRLLLAPDGLRILLGR